MREAAERRQQLELEHEQALAILNAKQQEIDLLQKVSWAGAGGLGGGRQCAGDLRLLS